MVIYLGLGTNEGNRERNLHKVIHNLKQNKEIHFSKVSSIYESEPIGYKDQPWFLNAVTEVGSDLQLYNLLRLVKSIEKQIGRKETFRWGPRIIDIDILSCEHYCIQSKMLTVPHPEMHLRKFVLLPLAEIAPNFVHPINKLPIQQMIKQCPQNQVHWYAAFND